MFTPQQSPLPEAMNTDRQPPVLKYLFCTLEASAVCAPFVCMDPYNGDYSGNYDYANYCFNLARSYRSHHHDGGIQIWNNAGHTGPYPQWHFERGSVDDTSSITDFYPSQSLSGPWYDPLAVGGGHPTWYWDDPLAWTMTIATPFLQFINLTSGQVSASLDPTYLFNYGVNEWVYDEFDESPIWNYMQNYLAAVDLAAPWVYTNPSRPNSSRVFTVNNFPTTGEGLQTDLSAIPPSVVSGSGTYDGFIYQTGATGLVTNTAQIQGAVYPGNAAGASGNHIATLDSLTGHLGFGGGPPSPTNFSAGLYTERAQVKFNLPITYTFVEVVQGYGRVNQRFYMMRGVGILPPETALEIPQPVLFPGRPFIFQGPTCPLAVKESIVVMLVNQTMESWIAHNDPTGGIVTPAYTGGLPPQTPPTMDSSMVTMDSTDYTMDAA